IVITLLIMSPYSVPFETTAVKQVTGVFQKKLQLS
ncbi:MAG: hypothetical protein EZS28_032539, partial [Streblomastix strix]